jgi:soluble lytic murein transglycosylase-like protein
LPKTFTEVNLIRQINKLLAGSALTLSTLSALSVTSAFAGAQVEEKLSHSVRSVMQRAIADQPSSISSFATPVEEAVWLDEMSRRLQKRIPDAETRFDLLRAVHYEATRAGLDPEMVLGLIQVESGFRKYAVSSAGARGFMQVMPFWQRLIGTPDQNLFHLRTNLRYGCTILRHYLQREKGDYFRALGRYNGSLGRAEYPRLVVGAWKNNWTLRSKRAASASKGTRG